MLAAALRDATEPRAVRGGRRGVACRYRKALCGVQRGGDGRAAGARAADATSDKALHDHDGAPQPGMWRHHDDTMQRAPLDASRLEVRTLRAEDAATLAGFDPGDEDLADFVRTDAIRLQAQGVARTYLAFYDDMLQGYITLLADAVVLETRERKRLALSSQDHPVVPALKIARLAVGVAFRATCNGMGTALVRLARSKALVVLEHAGCRLLTVDAYPQSVAFYEKVGFERCKASAYRDRKNASMWLDVLVGPASTGG